MKYEDFIIEISKIRKIISGSGQDIIALLPPSIDSVKYRNALNGRLRDPEALQIIYRVCKDYADALIQVALS